MVNLLARPASVPIADRLLAPAIRRMLRSSGSRSCVGSASGGVAVS
jgi:hypothetical protein